jgi:hypothetical protein
MHEVEVSNQPSMPTPTPRSKWEKAIEKTEDPIDSLDKVMIGALCGSQADKAICIAYLSTIDPGVIQSRKTTGALANEVRWRKLAF